MGQQIYQNASVLQNNATVTIPGDVRADVHQGYEFLTAWDNFLVAYFVGAEPTFNGTNSSVLLTAPYAGPDDTLEVRFHGDFDENGFHIINNNDRGTHGMINRMAARLKVLLRRVRSGSATTLTIAGGVVTVTGSNHAVDTEAAAATDNLDTITAGSAIGDGDLLVLRSVNTARDVVVKDGTGNVNLSGDFTLAHPRDRLLLQYDSSIPGWCEISRSNNG